MVFPKMLSDNAGQNLVNSKHFSLMEYLTHGDQSLCSSLFTTPDLQLSALSLSKN